ncbi:Photosystem I chlorophyll a apoprotein A2 [Capsicum chinense]|nr:Photosystem I chlorophyll a apoprotein A2 [Capsicum chinense]
MALRFTRFSQDLAQDPTTRRIWFGIATAHDFKSHDDITKERLYQNIFASHFGQLAIIFLWTSRNLFHVAWQGNFESWVQDPLHVRPIAHAIWDPHFGQPVVEAFTRGGALSPVNIAYSGVYQWWLVTPTTEMETERFLVQKCRISFESSFVRTFWRQWNLYAQNPDSSSHLFGTAQGAGTAILTLLGGFHLQTQSLWLTDIAHHHLAIAFIFLIAGQMYRTNFRIGHSMKDLLDAHIPSGGRLGRGHKGLYDTINNSLHFQLGLALASLGVITSLVAQHMYSLPAYAFIAQDFTISGCIIYPPPIYRRIIMTGAFAHGAIFFIRDYNPEKNEDNVLARMLDHKEAIISHLSWASLFLGFHTLGLYVHNDVMLAFGTPEKQILIEPIFAPCLPLALRRSKSCLNLYLLNGYNPIMVKLHMGLMYFYRQRVAQHSMRVEASGCRVG